MTSVLSRAGAGVVGSPRRRKPPPKKPFTDDDEPEKPTPTAPSGGPAEGGLMDQYWEPPYVDRSWRLKGDALLSEAGAGAAVRKRAAMSPADLVRSLLEVYAVQVPGVGVSPQLAEELCFYAVADGDMRLAMINAGAIAVSAAVFGHHGGDARATMGAAAVLGSLFIEEDGRVAGHGAGMVAVLVGGLKTHATHNGTRSWVCGALSNLLQYPPALDDFQDVGGVELLMGIITATGAVYEDEFDTNPFKENDFTNELIGAATRALRVCLLTPACVPTASAANAMAVMLQVLSLRGHHTDVRKGVMGCVKQLASYPEERRKVLAVEVGPYTIVKAVIKYCVRKVRTAPPGRLEGLLVTDDQAMVQVLYAAAYLFLDTRVCDALVDVGVMEVIVEVMRNVTRKTSDNVLFAALCAVLNATLYDAARDALVDDGVVDTVCAVGLDVLSRHAEGSIAPQVSTHMMAAVAGSLSGLALAPAAVSQEAAAKRRMAALAELGDGDEAVLGEPGVTPGATAALPKGMARGNEGMPSSVLAGAPSQSRASVATQGGPPLELPMVAVGIDLLLATCEFGQRLGMAHQAPEALRAAVQALANLAVMPHVQAALVSGGALPVILSLLDTHWENVPIVVVVTSFIANLARNGQPSYRLALYDVTDDTVRILRLLFQHMTVPTAMTHCLAALSNLWLAKGEEEVGAVTEALAVASPLQALHTVLRRNFGLPGVLSVGYRAIRNLAAIGDERWATRVGGLFLGPLLSAMRVYGDDPACVASAALCLAVMCRTEANREVAVNRDVMDDVVSALEAQGGDDPLLTVALLTAVAQLALSTSVLNKAFPRRVLRVVLETRAAWPGYPDIHFWSLIAVHNVSAQDDEQRVWVSRQREGMALLLEARQTHLDMVAEGGLPRHGGGLLPHPWQLAITPASVPQF